MFFMPNEIQTERARFFRQLHQPGNPFILANAWDIGSAKTLAACGAVALATTSAGHAWTLGRPDMGNVSRAEAVAHAAQLAAAVHLPVSGDFENGYGHAPEDTAETVRQAIDAGLAGCSIEDTMLPGAEPYPPAAAAARIEAAVKAARNYAADFIITARADGIMNGRYDTEEAIRRLRAFEKAGADVLYAPLPPDMDSLARICDSVSAPVNVLAAGKFCQETAAAFARIGAARISLGSSLARTAQTATLSAARKIFSAGDFSPLLAAAHGEEMDALLEKGAKATAAPKEI